MAAVAVAIGIAVGAAALFGVSSAMAGVGGALLVGLSSSVVWTFGVDHLVSEGGLSSEQSRIFLGVVGLATLGGGLGGDAVRRLGGRATFAAAVAAGVVAREPDPETLRADRPGA